MGKLTAKLIESVALPLQGQVILRCAELKGFGLRLTPTSMSYIVEARVNGKPKRFTFGRADLLSAEDARKEAMRLLAQMTAGIDPQMEKHKHQASTMTLGEVLDNYLAVQRLRPLTRYSTRRHINYYLKDWLGKPVMCLTAEMVQTRHRDLAKPNKLARG